MWVLERWLSVCCLAEDPGWVPNTHTGRLTVTSKLQLQGIFWPPWHVHT